MLPRDQLTQKQNQDSRAQVNLSQALVEVLSCDFQVQAQYVLQAFWVARNCLDSVVQALHDLFPGHDEGKGLAAHSRSSLLLLDDLVHEMAVVALDVVHNHACPVRQYCRHLNPSNLVLHDDGGHVAPHVVIG